MRSGLLKCLPIAACDAIYSSGYFQTNPPPGLGSRAARTARITDNLSYIKSRADRIARSLQRLLAGWKAGD